MREIKIRAWDIKKKEFEKNFLIKCNGDQGNLKLVNSESKKSKVKVVMDQEIIFLLNTGLKDKNGVHGFHKDIVRDFRGDYYVIEWDDPYATFILKKINDHNFLPVYFLQYGEIIGNTFQNPDFFNNSNNNL